jgi:hypothetical protein
MRTDDFRTFISELPIMAKPHQTPFTGKANGTAVTIREQHNSSNSPGLFQNTTAAAAVLTGGRLILGLYAFAYTDP